MKRLGLLAILLLPTAALAEIGIEAKASTLGLGAEIHFGFTSYLNLRVGLNNYSYTYDTTEDDINYNFDLKLRSTSVLLDFHPFGGTFRLTGGMLKNENEFQGNAALAGSYDIGGNTYTSAEVGTLSGNISFDSPVPYVGFGWANNPGESGFGVSFDIGLVMQGEPKADLFTQGGTLLNDPQFQDDLAAEELALQEDMKEFDAYPVISFGLQYRF